MGSSMSSWMAAWEQDLTPSPAARRSQARVTAQVRESVPAQTRSSRYYTREATARVPMPVERPEEESRELPELSVVARRRPRLGLALLTVVFAAMVLGVVIIAPVLINSATRQTEAGVGKMQAQQDDLTAQTAALSAQISTLSSPDRVAEQASQLGLGPAESVHYVTSASQSATAVAGSAETAAMDGDTTVAGR